MKYIKPLIASLAVFLLLAGGIIIYLNQNEDSIDRSDPLPAHHHIRMQLVVNGESIDFSQDQFQEPYEAGQCTGGLTDTPIHFHDRLNNIIHIHWDKITGGEVLKYFGLNRIGGDDSEFTYQSSNEIEPQTVTVKGADLIPDPKSEMFWVYVGDSDGYEVKSFEDFLNQDLETFFGVESELTKQRREAEELLFLSISAHAHNRVDHNENPTQEELKELQSVLGDIVIFAQENEPSEEDIQIQFDTIQPLQNSVCGG